MFRAKAAGAGEIYPLRPEAADVLGLARLALEVRRRALVRNS
jgi:hypothetical protein